MKFKHNKKLCLFHIDLNYSCLREDYLRKWLKKISDAGYNAILWEIEDKVQLTSCPECVWPEAYTKEQFKDILDYSTFMLKVEHGFDIIDYWFKALWMQLYIVKVGKQILNNQVSVETILILNNLKEQFHNVLLKSETPKSAEKNSNLVFDWLIEYCGRKCK